MKKFLIVLLCLGMIGLMGPSASAETIKLKSGKQFEGKIVERTEKYIKADIGVGIPITYFLDEVESIDGKLTAQLQPGTITDKDKIIDILKKSKNTKKNQKRLQIISVNKSAMGGLLREESENTMIIDFENKEMFFKKDIKELKMGDMDQMIEEKIAIEEKKAKLKGMSAEKLANLRKAFKSTMAPIKKMMEEVIEQLKDISANNYIIDNMMYIEHKGRWFKMDYSQIQQIWEAFDLIKQIDPLAKEKFDADKLKDLTPAMQVMINKFLGFEDFDLSGVNKIGEGEFRNIPCYIVYFEGSDKFFDQMKGSLISLEQIQGKEQGSFNTEDVSIESTSLKEYLSKDDYKPLGSLAEIHMSVDYGSSRKPMKCYIISSSRFDDSVPRIILPPEAQNAVLVKDEKELMDVIMPKDMFEDAMKK